MQPGHRYSKLLSSAEHGCDFDRIAMGGQGRDAKRVRQAQLVGTVFGVSVQQFAQYLPRLRGKFVEESETFGRRSFSARWRRVRSGALNAT